jgi:hypothetical protein
MIRDIYDCEGRPDAYVFPFHVVKKKTLFHNSKKWSTSQTAISKISTMNTNPTQIHPLLLNHPSKQWSITPSTPPSLAQYPAAAGALSPSLFRESKISFILARSEPPGTDALRVLDSANPKRKRKGKRGQKKANRRRGCFLFSNRFEKMFN